MATDRNTYMVDARQPAEMERLLRQEKVLTKAMGGLLAGVESNTEIQSVLDIACGPGGWVRDLAFEHPEMQVVGIDLSQRMIEYATEQAHVQHVANASFRSMDATQPLDFPDRGFDWVNVRFISTFMKTTDWSFLLGQCRRILKPGGLLRITDFERALTNSPAHERIGTLQCLSLLQRGMSFAPDGNHMGVLPVLAHLIKKAGFENVKSSMFGIDYSFGSPVYEQWCQDLTIWFLLTRPFVVSAGVATEEEMQRLYERVLVEMANPEFCALAPCLMVCAHAPAD